MGRSIIFITCNNIRAGTHLHYWVTATRALTFHAHHVISTNKPQCRDLCTKINRDRLCCVPQRCMNIQSKLLIKLGLRCAQKRPICFINFWQFPASSCCETEVHFISMLAERPFAYGYWQLGRVLAYRGHSCPTDICLLSHTHIYIYSYTHTHTHIRNRQTGTGKQSIWTPPPRSCSRWLYFCCRARTHHVYL